MIWKLFFALSLVPQAAIGQSAIGLDGNVLLGIKRAADKTLEIKFSLPDQIVGNCLEGGGAGVVSKRKIGGQDGLRYECYYPALTEDELRYASVITSHERFEIYVDIPSVFAMPMYPSSLPRPDLDGFQAAISSRTSVPGAGWRWNHVGYHLVVSCAFNNPAGADCSQTGILDAALKLGKTNNLVGLAVANDLRGLVGGSWKDKICYLNCPAKGSESHGGG